MIIPSIDLASGDAVQLIGGREQALNAGHPAPLAEKFGRVGEIAVIDLDAARGQGHNTERIRELLALAPCRVGGGIRDAQTAISWLDAGAKKVILGTAATPEILSQLPRNRLIAALDAVHTGTAEDPTRSTGQVVDQGWTRETGATVLERIEVLRDLVGGFLITFVEREGRMAGIDLEQIKRYLDAAGDAQLTIAGGVATVDEIAALDRLGIDAQVGMALYTEQLTLAECFCAPLVSDRTDGLWPTVVCNASGQTLGLTYSNLESVQRSLDTGTAHYFSRKRGLWRKGETSGATQEMLSIHCDCDRDTLMFAVNQQGHGFCHLSRPTCFGDLKGIQRLETTLADRMRTAPESSYTHRLFQSPALLAEKIAEEARELNEAVARQDVIHEAADVIFFTMARLAKEQIPLSEIEHELDRRADKVTRRDTV